MDTPTGVVANVDLLGRGPLIVNGDDVSDRIVGATITIERGAPTRLALYLDTPVELRAAGADVETQTLGPTVADFVTELTSLHMADVRNLVDLEGVDLGTDRDEVTIRVAARLAAERLARR
jgi:hypothetical protein